jgi:hypothetical protein
MEDITNLRKKVEKYEMVSGNKKLSKTKVDNTVVEDIQKLADDA